LIYNLNQPFCESEENQIFLDFVEEIECHCRSRDKSWKSSDQICAQITNEELFIFHFLGEQE